MQKSMTGYGNAEGSHNQFTYTVEIKTLNSKFLDYHPRYSKELSEKDLEIKNIISEKLKRGKVNISIDLIENKSNEPAIQINEELFKIYHEKFKKLADSVGDSYDDIFKLALNAPDVLTESEISSEDIDWDTLKQTIENAANACDDFRKKEGKALSEKLNDYIKNIDNCLLKIIEIEPERTEKIKTRLLKNIEELKDKIKIDENRFEQELIYYIEKFDITEEKVRLNQHLKLFSEVILNEPNAGKKLNFISQEIGREINTIGSKANHSQIQQLVVEMKDELEKIKEQLLNIL